MATDPKKRFLNVENLIWLGAPFGAFAVGYVIFATTVWLSTRLARSGGGGLWPSPRTSASALWAMLSDGARIDDWLLTNTTADAISSPLWLWALAAAQFVLVASIARLAYFADREIGQPRRKPRDLAQRDERKQGDDDRAQRHAAKSMRVPRWPARGPYSSPKNPSPGVLLGCDRRHLIADTTTTPVLVSGPASSGKTRRVIAPNVALWPGPVIATSVKRDLAELTVSYRAERGPIWGFDPTGRLWPAMRALDIEPVVWDPVRLLASSPDPNDALMFAEFLMGQVSAANTGNQPVWKNHSVQTMTRMLVIARDLEQPLSQVLRWMAEPKHLTRLATEPALLQRLSPDGHLHFEMLSETMKMDELIVDSIKSAMAKVSNLLEWTSKNSDATLMPINMTTDGTSGTLYLVADPASMESHAAIFAGSLRHLFHSAQTFSARSNRCNRMVLEARQGAAETASERLGVDPAADPLTRVAATQPRVGAETDPAVRPLFALDELASLVVLEDLPEIVSTIRTRTQLLCGIREVEQLSRCWGADGAKNLLENHLTRLQLGGSGDADAMRSSAAMSGHFGAPAAEMRVIDEGRALVTHDSLISFEIGLVDMERFIDPGRVSEIEPAAALVAEVASPAPPRNREPDSAVAARQWLHVHNIPTPADSGARQLRVDTPEHINWDDNTEPTPADDDRGAGGCEDSSPLPHEQSARSSALAAVRAASAREQALGAIGAAAEVLSVEAADTPPDGLALPTTSDHDDTDATAVPHRRLTPAPLNAAEARVDSGEPSESERLRVGTWLLDGLSSGGGDPSNVTIVAEMLDIDSDKLGQAWRTSKQDRTGHE